MDWSIDWAMIAAIAGTIAVVLQLSLTAFVILRVMLTRHPPGSGVAWILLSVSLPFVGFFLYVMFGERPIGRWRAFRMKKYLKQWEDITNHRLHHTPPLPAQRHKGLVILAERLGDMPTTIGSKLELIDNAASALEQILQDVRNAQNSINMEFYIWGTAGYAETISLAIIQAAQRGVTCRILVDDVGSREFLRTAWPKRMQDAGVHISRALPVHFFSLTKGRADLRLHRKTIIIDDLVAYTGSLNMIDVSLFNKDEGAGQWIDAMVRVEGSAVSSLNQVFWFDWALQPEWNSSEMPEQIPVISETPPLGNACVTVLATGPTTLADANKRVLLEAINCARQRILITTPYFVPGETLALALQNAALRGVDVRICLPYRNDSPLVHWASRRYFGDLMNAGVKLLSFPDGLLHTKAITVDEDFSLFGTLNMDNRSFELNFELMLLTFDKKFVQDLAHLQTSYEVKSHQINPELWHKRPLHKRLLEGLCYLLSPLL